MGIGGSGMCPLAEILKGRGFELTGSDINESDTLERIREYGIKVYMGQKAENIEDAKPDVLCYTAAISDDNPELVAAREKGIVCLERSEMLGIVADKYRRSVAISGTHGKTSTTGMLTQILVGSGKEPSAIIGGKLPYIGGNSIVGKSDIMVCEACEYVDSFLELHPYISVVLNVDADHLDYFKNLGNIKKSFNKFAHQTSNLIVYNGDNANAEDALEDVKIKKLTFGLSMENDYYAMNLRKDGITQSYDLMFQGQKLTTVNLSVPGIHNVYNSLAAATVADYLGVPVNQIAENLQKFTGVHRRFELLGKPKGITVVDDFAHHPTELASTLNTAMELGFKHVWAVFQPHTFSRTAMLLDDFAEALKIPDTAIISEILPVRETNTYNIYSTDLGAKVPG
ncbi:MAG: UDP-N-acetylmuramate--L-alanine ligase, partial [Oscillospiraceae bacterium]|nr:UDP-N-acetylmuramate--L-alanine ligase [Oscillospiraceae bacterium]